MIKNQDTYQDKYLKYKNKYLNLINNIDGGSKRFDSDMKEEMRALGEYDNDIVRYSKLKNFIKQKQITKFENLLITKNLFDNEKYYIKLLKKILDDYKFYVIITDKIINFLVNLNITDIDYYLFYETLGDKDPVSYKILSLILEKDVVNINEYIDLNSYVIYKYVPIINLRFKSLRDYNFYENKITPINFISKYGNAEKLQILLEYGADPNIPDIKNRLPIHRASNEINIDMLKLLIPRTKNINHVDDRNQTAIFRLWQDLWQISIKNINIDDVFDIILLFIKYGADLFIIDKHNNSFLNYIEILLHHNKCDNIPEFEWKLIDFFKDMFIKNDITDNMTDNELLNDLLIVSCNLNSYELYSKIKIKLKNNYNINKQLKIVNADICEIDYREFDKISCLTTYNKEIINNLLADKMIINNEIINDAINYKLLYIVKMPLFKYIPIINETSAIEIIEILYNYNKNFNLKLTLKTILMLPIQYLCNNILFNLIFILNIDFIKEELKKQIHINEIYKIKQLFTKLIKNNYDPNMMLTINLTNTPIGELIHTPIIQGTLLTVACINNDIDLIKDLMLNNANKNIKDSTGRVPFVYLNSDIHDDIVLKNIHFEYNIISNDETPKYLTDPVTLEIYRNPYIASDGNTYSKFVLETLFSNSHNPNSPLTNQPLTRINGRIGIPNILVRQLTEKFFEGKIKVLKGGSL